MLSLTLFGHFQATLNDDPLSLPTKSVSALVAYLYLERETPQPRAHLAALLWPDSTDSQGRRNMRQTLFRLRQAVPDTAVSLSSPQPQPLILNINDTLQWNPAYPTQSDVQQFEQAMALAEPFLHMPLDETPYSALAPLRTAVALCPANLLLGFDLLSDFYAEWLHPWRIKYQRQAVTGLARLAASYGRAGQPRQMEQMGRQQLALVPHREEAHQQVMQACLAQGEYTAVLTQYSRYQKHLQEEGLEPPPAIQALRDMADTLRQGASPPLPPLPHNLPPEETPFYGRQQELDDLLLWLVAPTQRLLTLKGLGGMGKTRLALAAGRRLTRPWPTLPPRFPGGVWFVSLADVQNDDDESVAEAIVQTCGWATKQNETALAAVTRYLQKEAQLLILDNLEHLPRMAELVLQLLTAVSSLTILATSRHQLGLQREVVRHLHGLPMPQHERDMTAPSIALLIERIQRVDSGLRLTTAVVADLVRICRILEGWPLALELAAGWVEVMYPHEIAERVASNMAALHTAVLDLPPRHRSMEAALSGSYTLLTPDQQTVLARFALFRAGCTAVAARTILHTTKADLALLVRRALLQKQGGRYTIHELIRQFALDKLTQTAPTYQTTAQRAHAEYYLALLTKLEPDLYGSQPLAAIHQLRPERENIYQAWAWGVENEAYEMLQAALPSLTRFYSMAGLLREGEVLLRETRTAVGEPHLAHDLLLAHINLLYRLGHYDTAHTLLTTLYPVENLPPRQQLEAHLYWGKLNIFQGDIPQSRYHYEQALPIAHALENQAGIVSSLVELGILSDYDQRYEAELLTILPHLQDIWLQRAVYSFLGAMSIRHSLHRHACVHWQKALDISLELEDWYASASFYNNMGDALRELGQFEEAEHVFQQAVTLALSFRNDATRMHALEGWARLAVLQGAYPQAQERAQEAVDLAVVYKRQSVQQAALGCLGHALVGQQQWAEAQEAYAQATQLMPDIPHLALEGQAGLAYVSWQRGDLRAARIHISHFLEGLDAFLMEGFTTPSLSYRRGVKVLRAVGEEPQARALLAKAHAWLEEQVQHLTDEGDKAQFWALHAIEWAETKPERTQLPLAPIAPDVQLLHRS